MHAVALFLVLVVVVGSPAPGGEQGTQAGTSALAACWKAQEDFDAAGMVSSCQEAADDPRAAPADRVVALGVLAVGQVLSKNDRLAELAFTKMLLLDHEAAPAADAGPQLLGAYQRARSRVLGEGAVKLSVHEESSGDSVALRAEVTDPLGRVATVELRAQGVSQKLARLDAAPGRAVFTGTIATPEHTDVRWQLVALGPTGKAVQTPVDGSRLKAPPAVAAPLTVAAPVTSASEATSASGAASATDSAGPTWQAPVGWSLVGVGGAVGLASVVGAAAVTLDLGQSVPCGNGQRCAPECMGFGQYCGTDRPAWLQLAPTLVGSGVVASVAGATAAVVGAALLLTPDETMPNTSPAAVP